MTPPERALRHDELLSHLGWVQGLALRLARDTARAEDIAQEAIARTLARPPRDAHSGPVLRAFLATLTRLVARDERRAESRRGRRERDLARSEALPSTLDVVERNALVQQVSAAVMGLREPYRSTVLYRYLDGCSTARIAELMDTNAAAVRKRLSRALAELRGQMDEGAQGLPGQWALALLPVGTFEGVAATKKALVGGGLLMIGKVQVAAGIAMVGGTALVVNQSLSESSVELEPIPFESVAPSPALVATAMTGDSDLEALEAMPSGESGPVPVSTRVPAPERVLAKRRRSSPSAVGFTEAEVEEARDVQQVDELLAVYAQTLELQEHVQLLEATRLISLAQRLCGDPNVDPSEAESCNSCHAPPAAIASIAFGERTAAVAPSDGLHTEHHENGQPGAQGLLRNGARVGSWTEWHEDGSTAAQGDWFDGERHGWWVRWHSGGKRSAEGEYLYGEREGSWSEFHEDGTRARTVEYRNGKRYGLERTWHPGGKELASEVEIYSDEPEGEARTWHENGTLASEGRYEDGEPVGTWSYWDADGVLDEGRSGRAE